MGREAFTSAWALAIVEDPDLLIGTDDGECVAFLLFG